MDRVPEDVELIERLRAGDQAAVAELATTYGSKIQQLALRHMKNHEDAEEVAQDVLLKVCRKIAAFRGDSALSSWIYRITFNTAMSRLRTVRFSRPAEIPEHMLRTEKDDAGGARRPEPADPTSLPDESYLRSEVRERLREAMTDLAPIYRTPVVLRDIHGLSTEEASDVLGVKPQTLKSRLHRGRLALRARLVDFDGGLSLHPAV
jgi:RNA polymerase sigma-70 factor (ECF subfamily)